MQRQMPSLKEMKRNAFYASSSSCWRRKMKNGNKMWFFFFFFFGSDLPDEFNYMVRLRISESVCHFKHLTLWNRISYHDITTIKLWPIHMSTVFVQIFLRFSLSPSLSMVRVYSSYIHTLLLAISSSSLSFKKRQFYNFVNIEHPKWFSGLF